MATDVTEALDSIQATLEEVLDALAARLEKNNDPAKWGTLSIIGVEGGQTVSSLRTALLDQKVDLVVDVRLVSISKNPAMSQDRLQSMLRQAGIHYLHEPLLGCPRGRSAESVRRRDERYAKLLREPKRHQRVRTIAAAVAGGNNVCLLGRPVEANQCHRRVLASTIATKFLPGVDGVIL